MAIVGEAHVIVKAITTGFEESIQNAVRRANLSGQGSQAGQQFGGGFSKGAKKGLSGFAREAEEARIGLQNLVIQSNFVGPAIAGVVSAVGALASGLYAMASQAASAAPSLIVLPSLLTAMAQAAITAKLALGGVFKAVGELGRAKTPAVDQMPAKLSAFEAAQNRLRRSTDALEKAYRNANERIEQLAFSIEDAAIAETRAAMTLNDARATLARVQDLPPNSRARKEAELAFKEADLNYRRAVDTSKDLADEQNRVTKDGTLNSDEQVAQSEEVVNAIYEKEQATKAVAKAQLELNKAQKGGDMSSAPEFNKLTKEAQEFAKYLVGLKPEIQALKDAAGKEMFGPLENAIQNIVDKLFPRLKPLLQETGKAFGETMLDFSKIVTQKKNLENFETVGRTNIDTISKFGTVIGNLYSVFITLLAAADPLIRRFTDWVVVLTDGWKATRKLKQESGELTSMFNTAGDSASQLGRIFGNIFTALMDIGKAASGPGSGGQMLMDSFEGATEKFEELVKKMSADGTLQQYFRDVVPTVEAIGRIFVGIGKGILKMGDNKETATAFQSLEKTVPVVFGALDQFSKATPALGEFVRKLVELLAKFAESDSINIFFAILNKVLDVLIAIFSNKIIAKIFIFAASLKAIFAAFSVLNMALGFYAKAIAGTIIKVVGLGSATRGAAIIQGLWNKIMHTSWLQTKLLQLMYLKDAIAKKIATVATKAWAVATKALGVAMKFATGPIGLTILAIVALIAIIIIAYKKFGWFRSIVDAVFSAIKFVISGVWDGILAKFNAVWDVISTAIPFVWNNIIKPIFEAYGSMFALVWSGIRLYFETVWAIISTAIPFVWNNIIKPTFEAFGIVFRLVWDSILFYFNTIWTVIHGAITFAWNNIIRPVFEAFGTIFSKVWDGIKKAFSGAWDFITKAIDGAKTIFGKIGDAIIAAFKAAINFIIRGWNKIEFKIPGFKIGPVGYSGFTLGLPDIPELAEGGIINPTPGGTLARIGEAGRAERVEPLDPDGLSKRDKAMIAMLSGGAGGGITLNVYPSPGMNEIELAALVNRQLAFQLRRGAA